MSEFDHAQFLKTLSSEPGVYRMLDNDNQVIYVGKAKSLKKAGEQLLSQQHYRQQNPCFSE